MEDNVLARLYRESPINAIWEGSGNIKCLDVVRALEKNPDTLDIFLIELEKAKNHLDLYDEALGEFKQQLLMKSQNEYALRQFVESMALLWQAATLIQFSDATIAESFVLSRLAHNHSYMYGTLPEHIPFRTIIQRAEPKI